MPAPEVYLLLLHTVLLCLCQMKKLLYKQAKSWKYFKYSVQLQFYKLGVLRDVHCTLIKHTKLYLMSQTPIN